MGVAMAQVFPAQLIAGRYVTYTKLNVSQIIYITR